MNYQVARKDEAQEQIRRLSPGPRRSVNAVIRKLHAGPHLEDSKALRGFDTLWRVRVGRWRIIFDLNQPERTITILRVGPRKTVYEGLDDLLREEPPRRR